MNCDHAPTIVNVNLCDFEKLLKLGELIMSAISEFAAKQREFNNKLNQLLGNIAGDIKNLNDKITALQNSSGVINAEDQALLDEIQGGSQSALDKMQALDDLTPPVVPQA